MTAPAGSIMLAQDNAKNTLADVTAFRTWAGASNQAEALALIYHDGLPPPADRESYTKAELELYRPCALFWTDPDAGFGSEVIATSGDVSEWEDRGKIVFSLEENVPADIAEDLSEVDLRFKNSIGQIMDGLKGLFGKAGYLACLKMDMDGPHRVKPDNETDQGDWMIAIITLAWGRL